MNVLLSNAFFLRPPQQVRKGVLVSQDASGGATLVVEKTSMTDAGTYTAVGTNDVGQAETSCEVKVRIMGFEFPAKVLIFLSSSP